jgi:hypothetical protein
MRVLFNIATVVEDEKYGRKWDDFKTVFKGDVSTI